MWISQLVIFVVVLKCAFTNDRHSPCTTPEPESEDGMCVSIIKCPDILKLLKEGTSDEKEFARKSFCSVKRAKVCCKSMHLPTTAFSLSSIETITVKASADINLGYFNTTDIPDRGICGPVKGIDKIQTGNETDIGQFPWIAALAYTSAGNDSDLDVKCGGSLITTRYVLTAAHCIRDFKPESIRVLLGEWRLSTDPDCISESVCAPNVTKLEVDKLISHQKYSRLEKRNDIGLIRLKHDVYFTDFVRPICLLLNDIPILTNKDLLLASGWGRKTDGSQADVAFKSLISLITEQECLQLISRNRGILPTELCAMKDNTRVCNGDSGGPLMRLYRDEHNFNWFLEGVLASGIDCHTGVSALIYTRVSTFTSWILKTIAENS